MAKINTFNVPYPDFKLLDVIDPDQFDANNEEIVNKVNEVIDNMLDVEGDFKGTWHGVELKDASESINGGRLDVIEPIVDGVKNTLEALESSISIDKESTDTAISDLKRVSKNTQQEVANLNLHADASNRVKNGYTFGTNFDSQFGIEVDYTKQHVASTLSSGQTFIPLVSSEGLKVGQEVTVYDDKNLERVKIKEISGNSLIIETALENSYNDKGMVARTSFEKDTLSGGLKLTGVNKHGTTEGLGYIAYQNTSNYTANTCFEANIYNSSNSSIDLYNASELMVEMDLFIPSYDETSPNLHYEKTILGFRGTSSTSKGFSFGCSYSPNTSSNLNYFSSAGTSLEGASYTFYVSVFQADDRRALITCDENVLKPFLDKTISVKLIYRHGYANDDIPAGFELYVNGTRLPFTLKYITGSVNDYRPARYFYFGVAYKNSTQYWYPGTSRVANLTMYKGINDSGIKLVEYKFDSSNTATSNATDLSGNGIYASFSSTYSKLFELPNVTSLIDEGDIRFTSKLDSKEIGIWATSSNLEAIEGEYSGVPLDLTAIEDETQFIGSSSESVPTEVRLTFKKKKLVNNISKIIGGVM